MAGNFLIELFQRRYDKSLRRVEPVQFAQGDQCLNPRVGILVVSGVCQLIELGANSVFGDAIPVLLCGLYVNKNGGEVEMVDSRQITRCGNRLKDALPCSSRRLPGLSNDASERI